MLNPRMATGLFCVMLLLQACVTTQPNTYETIQEQVLRMNYDDGISREEAIILAKKYFLEKGYTDSWSIYNPKAKYYKPTKDWWVEFGTKYYYFSEGRYHYSLRIRVSADSGKISGEAVCRYY